MSTTLAGLEVVALSPAIPQTPLPFSVRVKRRVTPSLESAASNITFLVVSRDTFASQLDTVDFSLPSLPSIPNCLFQGGEAQIVARLPLNLLHQESRASLVDLPRHIILPFDLRDSSTSAWNENADILISLFSGCVGFGFDGHFLLYRFHILPPKPWPKTIADMPCYFVIGDTNPSPLPPMIPAHMGNAQLSKDVDGRNLTNWDSVFDIMKNHFEDLGIAITEIQYWGTYVMIVLKIEAVDVGKIPKRIANLRCFYLYENQMGRPEVLQARRQDESFLGNADETKYDVLRPGVRLASGHDPREPGGYLSTTAGVLVKDRIGNVFMTAASHGFPSGRGTTVYQPTPVGDHAIGKLVGEISHTDIALVRLNDDVAFENVTFHGDILTKPMRLDRFASTQLIPKGEIVQLDSPDTGYIEGTLRISSRTRVPADDGVEQEQKWLHTTWFYMGQDCSHNLPDGMGGSAIWAEDGSVLGFFLHSPKTGVMTDWCAGIAADELISRGYTVVAPPMI